MAKGRSTSYGESQLTNRYVGQKKGDGKFLCMIYINEVLCGSYSSWSKITLIAFLVVQHCDGVVSRHVMKNSRYYVPGLPLFPVTLGNMLLIHAAVPTDTDAYWLLQRASLAIKRLVRTSIDCCESNYYL